MHNMNDQDTELGQSKVLKVAGVDTARPPALKLTVSTKNSGPLNFKKLMAETSEQEFLETLDNASIEELAPLLQQMEWKNPEVSLSNRLEKNWRVVMTVPAEPRNFLSVLSWWESRRALYNVVVGPIGLFMAALDCYVQRLPGNFLIYAAMICAVTAVLANVCYSLGTILELIARSIKKYDRYGPILFTLGLTFSIFVVLSMGIIFLR
jgi:hypothetical protein